MFNLPRIAYVEEKVHLDVIIYGTGFVTVRAVRLRQRHSYLSPTFDRTIIL